MVDRESFKIIFAKYKKLEKCFFRADKKEDKACYLKLKYQFRIMLTIGFINMLFSLMSLILYGQLLLTPFPMFAAVLIGFRFKYYNVPRTMVFVVNTIIPLRFLVSDIMWASPVAIISSNVQILLQTQSERFTIAHLLIQTIVSYLYGIDRFTKKIESMTPQEIAATVQTAFYLSLGAAWINLITMQRFYSHMSILLRKIGALWNNILKANNQLNDQNLKLQSNLEMKDVFIYTFSHELKNALNGLLGNLYLAYETAKDPQVLQFLSTAKVCGDVLKNFIDNILDSGKLENGDLEVSPEKKDVMQFLESIWNICGRVISNKRLQGCLKVEKNVPRYLDLDQQRMIQIMLNLVSNAVKFTEKGHVHLHISWQTTSASCTKQDPCESEENPIGPDNQAAPVEEGEGNLFGDIQEFANNVVSPSKKENHHLVTEYQKKSIAGSQFYQLDQAKWRWNNREYSSTTLPEGSKGILKIQVVDSGCGMTQEAQAKLFQKLSQVNSIQDQRKVGTGLGLWICKELANRLDGDIKTRSNVGVGSVFELTIRTRVSHITKKSSFNHRVLNREDSNSLFILSSEQRASKMSKVLIADDDNFNVELMKNYLKKFGISYICAYDGEEAVSLFKKHHQDICYVITDNFMPKKTGTEAALEIASFLEEKRQPKIPILCISGDLKVSIGEKGITKMIPKPINFERLKEELMIIYPQLMKSTAEEDK